MHVFPQMVAVPRAQDAFGPDARLTDARARQKLQDALDAYVRHVGVHHPPRRVVIPAN